MTLDILLLIASGLAATTYGHGERRCGDIQTPRACAAGATTASGVPFDPTLPQVAIAAPTKFFLKPTRIGLKLKHGKCQSFQLVDKMNPRWIGERGFDLTPAAQTRLTGRPATKHWQAPVFVCQLANDPVRLKNRPNSRPLPPKAPHAKQDPSLLPRPSFNDYGVRGRDLYRRSGPDDIR